MTEEQIIQRAMMLDLEGESAIYDKETDTYYRLMLSRSFEARLRQANEEVREFYNILKNEILSFHLNGVQLSPRFSYKHETFKDNRNPGFVLSIRGKTLCINFALPLSYFEGKDIEIEDVSNLVMFADTPSMLRIRNEIDLNKAIDIINDLLYSMGYMKGFAFSMDYISAFTYLDTRTLAEKGLLRVEIEQIKEKPKTFKTFESAEEEVKVTHNDFKRREHEIVSDNRFNIEFHRSFLSKLIQSDLNTKHFYDVIKNEIMSYRKLKCHYYWGDETFRADSKVQAKLCFNGKTLCLYLDLDTKQFEGTKYQVENQSNRKKFACVPLLYRIRNFKKCRYALDLIQMAFKQANFRKNKKYKPTNYKTNLVKKSDEELLKDGLIRRVATRH